MRGSVQKRKAKDGTITYSILYDAPPKPGQARRQRRVRGFINKKAAEKKLHDVLVKIAEDQYFETSKTTLTEYAYKWLAEVQHRVKPRTYQTYKRWLKQHVLPRLGSMSVVSIKAQHLRDAYAEVLASGRLKAKARGPGLHPQSVVHIHRTVHTMFSDAVEGGVIERNPAAGMSRRLPRVPRVEQRCLSEAEAKRLLGASKGTRLEPFVTIALFSGARRGELLALTWPFVDLDGGRITITHTLGDDGSLAEPKRERSRRTIILPPAAVSVLRSHKVAQAEIRLGKGPLYNDRGFVFADELGQPWKLDSQATLFKAIAKRAGLGTDVHIHTLRHTFASLAIRAGVPITTLAAILGHDTAVLMRVYGHQIPSAEDTAAKALQQALAGA